jgi:hypothetical protein
MSTIVRILCAVALMAAPAAAQPATTYRDAEGGSPVSIGVELHADSQVSMTSRIFSLWSSR